MWLVYFLKAAKNKWYYVGSTDDLQRRLEQHNSGKVISTKHHKPLTVVRQVEFQDERSARAYERKVKKQRLLKEDIIRSIEM